MSDLPTREECLSMLKRHGCHYLVVKHCIFVERLAVRIAELCDADMELVRVGALLHDIGRAKTHAIQHNVEGVKIAKSEKLPQEIISIIENHLGAGVTKDEAKELGLPPKDYIPQTLEEKIVAHADNLAKGHKKWELDKLVKRLEKQGKRHVAEKILVLHRELSEKCGIDLDDLEV